MDKKPRSISIACDQAWKDVTMKNAILCDEWNWATDGIRRINFISSSFLLSIFPFSCSKSLALFISLPSFFLFPLCRSKNKKVVDERGKLVIFQVHWNHELERKCNWEREKRTRKRHTLWVLVSRLEKSGCERKRERKGERWLGSWHVARWIERGWSLSHFCCSLFFLSLLLSPSSL